MGNIQVNHVDGPLYLHLLKLQDEEIGAALAARLTRLNRTLEIASGTVAETEFIRLKELYSPNLPVTFTKNNEKSE